jgi:hypothetical protein
MGWLIVMGYTVMAVLVFRWSLRMWLREFDSLETPETVLSAILGVVWPAGIFTLAIFAFADASQRPRPWRISWRTWPALERWARGRNRGPHEG